MTHPRFRVPLFAAMSLVMSVAAAFVVLTSPTRADAAPPYPRVMASTGDSITRAFDANWSCFLQDCPRYSWSTGTSSSVYSHYRRLLTVAPQLYGRAYNDARSGARMTHLAGQLGTAASQSADYVTILMGANDVCTSSIGAMTPVATFESQFRNALTTFTTARPKARVFVSSIPNVYRLWALFRTNPRAVAVWQQFGICQSMLNINNTETQRQQVLSRLKADNAALARVCAEFRQCRWDDYATYLTSFATSDVSSVDYFHPSVRGENRLASVSWAASYWPSVGSTQAA
jgi:lysophospholipase L1-like esterase